MPTKKPTPKTRAAKPKVQRKSITNNELWGLILDVKTEVIGVRGDVVTLKEHVNERNDAIERSLTAMQKALGTKADRNELITSIGFRILAKPLGRFLVGLVGGAVIATATEAHWVPWVTDLIRLFVNTVT